jgi:hypothetical protein
LTKSEKQWKEKKKNQGEDFLMVEVVLDEDSDAQAEEGHLEVDQAEDTLEIGMKEEAQEIEEDSEVDHLHQDFLMILDLLDLEKTEVKGQDMHQEAMMTKEQASLALIENSLVQGLDTSHLSLTLELLEKIETVDLEVHSEEKESLTLLESEVIGFLRESEDSEEKGNHLPQGENDLLENLTDSVRRNLLLLENEVSEIRNLSEAEIHDSQRRILLISLKSHMYLRVLILAEGEISETRALIFLPRRILTRSQHSRRAMISEKRSQLAKLL